MIDINCLETLKVTGTHFLISIIKVLQFYNSVYDLIENSDVEQKEADKKEWVTEGDYFRWCQLVWEDRTNEEQRSWENEQWKNEQAYNDYQSILKFKIRRLRRTK
jgi:hypothetical protein